MAKSKIAKSKTVWSLYILECNDGSFYTGITTDITRRLSQHETGKGAKYTRGRSPLKIVYVERLTNRSDALIKEAKIKLLSKSDKAELIARSKA